jgi:hypothetical protein
MKASELTARPMVTFASLFSLGLLTLLGCGNQSEPMILSGEVTLDGSPVSEVRLVFRPQFLKGRTVSALVADGQFRIQLPDRLPPGRYDVLIVAEYPDLETFEEARPSGRNPLDPARIPAAYAAPGQLSVTIGSESESTHRFDMHSVVDAPT